MTDSNEATLPTFVVIGAQKAATTTVYDLLRQHPSVFLPAIKETNYFIDEGRWHRGVDWYRGLFADAGAATARGEVSPGYTMFPHYASAPERMAALIPNVRLVYLLRDPIARMRSAWLQSRSTGAERRDLTRGLLYESGYLLPSHYMLQIDQYLACFPREQLLVLRSDELERDPGPVIDRLLAFLGLPTGWRPPGGMPRSNPSEGKRVWRHGAVVCREWLVRFPRVGAPAAQWLSRVPMVRRSLEPGEFDIDADLHARLTATLRPDLERLAAFLDEPFDGWGLL